MCQAEGRLSVGPSDLQGPKLLSRIIRGTPDGLLYEADPRHAEQLLRELLNPERLGVRGILFPTRYGHGGCR
eukprot:9131628-Alexandrium_andersonii.AAC.1